MQPHAMQARASSSILWDASHVGALCFCQAVCKVVTACAVSVMPWVSHGPHPDSGTADLLLYHVKDV